MSNKKILKKYMNERDITNSKRIDLYNKINYTLSYCLFILLVLIGYFNILINSPNTPRVLMTILIIGITITFIYIILYPKAVAVLNGEQLVLVKGKEVQVVDEFKVEKLFLFNYKVIINGEEYYTNYGNVKGLLKLNKN